MRAQRIKLAQMSLSIVIALRFTLIGETMFCWGLHQRKSGERISVVSNSLEFMPLARQIKKSASWNQVEANQSQQWNCHRARNHGVPVTKASPNAFWPDRASQNDILRLSPGCTLNSQNPRSFHHDNSLIILGFHRFRPRVLTLSSPSCHRPFGISSRKDNLIGLLRKDRALLMGIDTKFCES
jgi:hypothetical protein